MGKKTFSTFSKGFPSLFLSFLLFLPVSAPAGDSFADQPGWIEPETDRPGSDFRVYWLRGGAEACREACAQNPLCKAYTYVRPGVPGRLESCWLKDSVPEPVASDCCTSGVKASVLVSREILVIEPPLAKPTPETPRVDVARKAKEPKPVPPTGTGLREVAGIDFAALPPGEYARRELPPVPLIPYPVTGTGRRVAAGVHFMAFAPLEIEQGTVPEAGLPEARSVGSALREGTGVDFFAMPRAEPTAAPAGEEMPRAGARRISGVNYLAIPPKR